MAPDQKRDASTRLLARLRFALMALAMVAAPLMIGSVFYWTAGVLAALVLGALLITAEYNRQRDATLRVSPLAAGFFAVVGISLVQLVPLPLGLLEIIAPRVHELYILGHEAAFGTAAEAARPISLDPASTADRALRFLALAMAALVAANVRSRDRAWRVVTGALVVAALASLGIGLLHTIFEMESFYGSYRALIEPRLSTFVSTNHAASLFGLASIVSLAFAYRSAQKEGRRNWLIATSIAGVVLFVAMLQGESAGVNLLMPLSLVVFVVSMQPDRRQKLALRVAGVLLGFGAIAAWLLSRGFLAETAIGRWIFNSLDIRLELADAAVTAAGDFFVSGAGNGAADQMIYPYVDLDLLGASRLVTIENEPFEWLFTLGVPTALVVIACLIMPVVSLRIDPDGSARGRFFVALTRAVWLFLAGVSLLHFPFVSLGVSLVAIIVFETLFRQIHHLHQSDGPDSPNLREYPFWHAGRRATVVIVGGCALTFGLLLLAGSQYAGPTNFTKAPRNAERAVRMTPGQARLYISLARDAREQKDWQRHLALLERAAALEPRVPIRLLHAFALWRAEERERAVEVWQELASRRPTPRRLGGDLALYAGDDPTLVAEVLESADAEVWRYTARKLGTLRGRVAAIQFALALVDQHPDHTTPYELVIESYWSAEMWDVAELWSRYLILTGQSTDEGPIGWGLYVDTLIRQGERDRARAAAAEALDAVPGDPAVSGAVMTLRTPDPTRANQAEVALIEKAHGHYCVAPLIGAKRTNCRRTQAWLHESHDEIDEAEEIYRSIYEASDDPRELGRFYLRQNRCVALRTLSVKAEDQKKAWLEKLYLQCASN